MASELLEWWRYIQGFIGTEVWPVACPLASMVVAAPTLGLSSLRVPSCCLLAMNFLPYLSPFLDSIQASPPPSDFLPVPFFSPPLSSKHYRCLFCGPSFLKFLIYHSELQLLLCIFAPLFGGRAFCPALYPKRCIVPGTEEILNTDALTEYMNIWLLMSCLLEIHFHTLCSVKFDLLMIVQ